MLLQARLASDGLIRVVDEGLRQAQKSKVQLDTDLEALEKMAWTVRKASFSNLAEVEEAMHEAGAFGKQLSLVRERFRQPFGCISVLIEWIPCFKWASECKIELLKAKDQEIAEKWAS